MFQQQKIDRSQLQRPDALRSTTTALTDDITPVETTLDELFADPIMSALWRAHGITESDARHAAAEATRRLKARSTHRAPAPNHFAAWFGQPCA